MKLLKQKSTIVVAIGVTQTLAFSSVYYLPAVLADPISKSLGITNQWFFAVFSGALVLSALTSPASGRFVDRYGGRNVLAFSSLLFAAGLLLLGLASDPIVLVFSWIILGIGMSFGLYEPAFATLTGLYGNKASHPIASVTLIAGFASTVGWPTTLFLSNLFGWRSACFIWSALHLLLGFTLNYLLIPPLSQYQPSRPFSEKLAPKSLFTLASIFAVIMFISTAFTTHLPRLLHDFGISLATATTMAAFLGPAQVCARVITYWISNHISPVIYARFAVVLHPIGGVCLIIFGVPAALVFVILHGMGNGILTIARGTIPLELFGSENYGLRTGLITLPVRLAQAAAPFVFGLVLDLTSPNVALITSAGLSIAAFTGLLFLSPQRVLEE